MFVKAPFSTNSIAGVACVTMQSTNREGKICSVVHRIYGSVVQRDDAYDASTTHSIMWANLQSGEAWNAA